MSGEAHAAEVHALTLRTELTDGIKATLMLALSNHP